ncbi:hypothetical protein ANCDUO_12254, partial [Ancylostoma duodenale]
NEHRCNNPILGDNRTSAAVVVFNIATENNLRLNNWIIAAILLRSTYTFYVLVFGFAVSVMNIAVTTLYSEIIGPRRQGTLQGIFQLAGSIGRMVAPLLTSFLYTAFGPQVPWITEVALICTTIALWIVFRNKMVPLQIGPKDGISSSKEES